MASDNALHGHPQDPESTSDNTQSQSGPAKRGRASVQLPASMGRVLDHYIANLNQVAELDPDTRRAYVSRIRQFLAWLDDADVDGDPLAEAGARNGAVRDYKSYLQTVAKRAPATINTVLAAIDDFYTRLGLGPAVVDRIDPPKRAPRSLVRKDSVRWLRAVEHSASTRDRLIGLLQLYAGLRIGEVVALDLDDIRMSARKGCIIVRSGKGKKYREVPIKPELRPVITAWLDDRKGWPGASDSRALLLNARGGRLSTRGASDVLSAFARAANIEDIFTPHVLRHTFGTELVRGGVDLATVAEMMGHVRTETTRLYAQPTFEDMERALDKLPVDR